MGLETYRAGKAEALDKADVAELDLLAEVIRAVRKKMPDEDDIIMLGDFQTDENHLGGLSGILGITAAISGTPTNTQGTQLVDNILFDRRATTEFTGRAEVVDFRRAAGLFQADALLACARRGGQPDWALRRRAQPRHRRPRPRRRPPQALPRARGHRQ